jgi:hypothetical protein
MLEEVGRAPDALRAVVAAADAATIARVNDGTARVPLTFKRDPVSTSFALKGYAFRQSHSEISGSTWIQYDPQKKQTYEIPNWNGLLPDISVAPPAAYAIPAPWAGLITRLERHGIAYRRLSCGTPVEAMGYHLDNPEWEAQPFEGHMMLRAVAVTPIPRNETLPPGSVIVPLDQPAANLAIELLEPDAPDSLLRWGMTDAIFEAKEYGEPRVVEKLARDMLAKDAGLKAEFEQKLANDAAFAGNPRARLAFFFQHSPWFAAQRVGAYPVLRLDLATLQALTSSMAPSAPVCMPPAINPAYSRVQ